MPSFAYRSRLVGLESAILLGLGFLVGALWSLRKGQGGSDGNVSNASNVSKQISRSGRAVAAANKSSSSEGGEVPVEVAGSADTNVGAPKSKSSAAAASLVAQQGPLVPARAVHHLEILVHNIAHTDLTLSLNFDSASERLPSAPSAFKAAVKKSSSIPSSSSLSSSSSSSSTPIDPVDPPSLKWSSSHESLVSKVSLPPLSSNRGDRGKSAASILCRPRFSAFLPFSQKVFNSLAAEKVRKGSLPVCRAPLYTRSDLTPRYNLVSPDPSEKRYLPTGFYLPMPPHDSSLPMSSIELSSVRLRGRDAKGIPNLDSIQTSTRELSTGLHISAVEFPLLSVLLPKFRSMLKDKYASSKNCKVTTVVILISGVGTPRNWTHSIKGNSTSSCGELMEMFINCHSPELAVVRVHSETNIFRYDENITFVKQELVPLIESYRNAMATGTPMPHSPDYSPSRWKDRPYNPDWRSRFHLTLSFADGSSARQYAIQSSLRSYRPTYLHFWQLKTYWHEDKVRSACVGAGGWMRRWPFPSSRSLLSFSPLSPHHLFFLQVCIDDIEAHSFEDMETDPPLEIRDVDDDIKAVVEEMKRFKADFEGVKGEGEDGSDLRQFWMRKTKKVVLAVLLARDSAGKHKLFRGTNMEVSMPTGSLCAERNVIGTALAENVGLKRGDLLAVAVLAVDLEGAAKKGKLKGAGTRGKDEKSGGSFGGDGRQRDDEGGHQSDSGSSPVRKVNIRKWSEEIDESPDRRRGQRTTIVTPLGSLNPLKPCGACNEWLKKIAEPNPSFKVVTFTDVECKGIYTSPVAMY